MKTNDKILAVLEKLKEEWDITPKMDSSSDEDIYRHYRKARETYARYAIWLNELPLDYFQLDSVLTLLRQEKFIEDFKFGEEVLTINFPIDFEEKYTEIAKEKLPIILRVSSSKDLATDTVLGKLASHSDGSIRYASSVIEMRNQIKDLCRLFIKRHKRLLTIDDIKENIINADKRKNTSNNTISKYVSELRNSLKIHFKKDVIFNQKEEGWYMDIEK